MKNNRFVYGLKTAGVVFTTAFTMVSCGNKQLSEAENQIVKHKVDSAAAEHYEYKMATGLLDLCDIKIQNIRKANKSLIKIYARDYIVNNVEDKAVKNFMVNAIEDKILISAYVAGVEKSDSISSGKLSTMRYICHNQKWFNDLVLFLNGNYDEQQLLDSGFFKVINTAGLERRFESNKTRADDIKRSASFARERKTIIYNQLWDQYSKEVKRKR